MITPGDIPESMVKKAAIMEQSSWDGGRWDNLIAMVLNEAIEAGLVSPPVWSLNVTEESEDWYEGGWPMFFATKRSAEHRCAEDGLSMRHVTIGHWKGQAQ